MGFQLKILSWAHIFLLRLSYQESLQNCEKTKGLDVSLCKLATCIYYFVCVVYVRNLIKSVYEVPFLVDI